MHSISSNRPSVTDVQSATDGLAGEFLQHTGNGRIGEVERMLALHPELVHATGPHPFWGGRPQALHVAIETGRRDLFDLLLHAGADPSGRNDEYGHWSPLMLAIQRNQEAMRDALREAGARTGIVEALMLGDDTLLDSVLLETGSLPEIVPNEGSLLNFARTPFAIDRLIELGAPVDLKDQWGTSPVESLSRLGARGEPLVRRLIQRGAKASPREYARLGELAVLQQLAQAGEAVTADEVLLAAVECGQIAVAAWLLAQCANANARYSDRSRHTALHEAAWAGDLRMVRLLVAGGADLHAIDEEHQTTPRVWAETASTVRNSTDCRRVMEYLQAVESRK